MLRADATRASGPRRTSTSCAGPRYYGIDVALEHPLGLPRRDRRRSTPRRRPSSRTWPTCSRRPAPAGSGWSGSARCSPSRTVPAAAPTRAQLPATSTRPTSTSTGSPTSSSTNWPNALPDGGVRRVRDGGRGVDGGLGGRTPPVLTYCSAPGFLQIYDGRHPDEHGHLHVRRRARRDLPGVRGPAQDRQGSAPRTGAHHAGRRRCDSALRRFADRGLMFLDEDLAMSLGTCPRHRAVSRYRKGARVPATLSSMGVSGRNAVDQ